MSQDSVARFKIEGVIYDIDINDLTIGEVEMIEKQTGKPLGQIDFESITAIAVLGWIARRRREPMFTIEDMRMIPVSQIEAVEDGDPLGEVVSDEVSTEGTSGNQS